MLVDAGMMRGCGVHQSQAAPRSVNTWMGDRLDKIERSVSGRPFFSETTLVWFGA